MVKRLFEENKQYFFVLTSTAVATILGFAINVLFTNFISVESYGFYKAVLTTIQFTSVVSLLGIHYTFGRLYANAHSKSEERNLSQIMIILSFIIYLPLLLMVILFIIINYYYPLTIKDYIIYGTLLSFCFLFYYLMQQYYQGLNKMYKFSLISLVPPLITMLLLIVIIIFKLEFSVTQVILFILISYLPMEFFFIRKSCSSSFKIKEIIAFTKPLLKVHYNHGFQLYLGSLFSVATAQVLNLVIASMSGLTTFAYFSFALTLATPISLIPSTMGTVIYRNSASAKKLTFKNLGFTLFISFLALILYSLLINLFLPYLIGTEYIESISIFNILVLVFMFNGLGDYFNKFINSKGHGKTLRNSAIITGTTLMISAGLLIPLYQVEGLIYSRILSSVIYLSLMIFNYIRIVRK